MKIKGKMMKDDDMPMKMGSGEYSHDDVCRCQDKAMSLESAKGMSRGGAEKKMAQKPNMKALDMVIMMKGKKK